MIQHPFQLTPDPAFLLLSPSHKEALTSIIYGIDDRKGFVVIVGETGTGKTTIVRTYLENRSNFHVQHDKEKGENFNRPRQTKAREDRKRIKPIYLFFNAEVTFKDLLKEISRELDVKVENDSLLVMVRRLYQALSDEYQKGYNIALIIDEAQNMTVETLEELRMLSNLETSKEKLLQIVLVGQPELDQKLNLNKLRQLKQRIEIRANIKPLTKKQSMTYILHRLSQVIVPEDRIHTIFSPGALKEIIKYSNGIPRIINNVCDKTLLAGFFDKQKPVSAQLAKKAISELEGYQQPHWLRRFAPAGSAAIATATILTFLLFNPFSNRDSQLITEKGNDTNTTIPPKRQSGRTHNRRNDTVIPFSNAYFKFFNPRAISGSNQWKLYSNAERDF